MQEQNLRHILGALGIQPGRANRNGWMEFPCPLAPWTHDNGYDQSPSAAAKVSVEGMSAFVCKACHQKGRISKLVRLLADFSNRDDWRPLMVMADRADSEAQITAGYPPFEQAAAAPDPEPLDEDAYGDIYAMATDHAVAMGYLASRGISPETATRLDLRFDIAREKDKETKQWYDVARVLFPVRDRNGALYGFTGRAVDPGVKPKVKDYFGLPKAFVVLGENQWSHDKPLLIVEGLFAFAHLHEIGIGHHASIGALLGSAMTEYKASRITHLDRPTYLLLDNDSGGDLGLFGTVALRREQEPAGSSDDLIPGREPNGAVHYLHGHVPIHIPDWPEGKDDPDQLTRDEVLAMLSATPAWNPEGENSFDKEWDTWV